MNRCELVLCASWLFLLCGCSARESADVESPEAPAPGLPPLSAMEVPVKEPSDGESVTVGIGVDPGSVAPGEVLTVAVRARMAPGWHIYAVDKPTDVQVPTTLELQVPDHLQPVGEWDIPEAHPLDESGKVYAYDQSVTFRRQLRVDNNASPGVQEVGCQFGYQSCTEKSCLPPKKVKVTVALEITE